MAFYADLHVHSKHSRATSADSDLEHMAAWARKKGLSVVGTGDFTHPAWFAELREKLVPAEPGLFRLRPEIEREIERRLGAPPGAPVRFLLEVEISTIYKLGDKTRKVHHLIYAPDFETAGRFRERLARIGNIASDGRPILGLDSRSLLEIALESGDGAYLIPAHIWTPWFAVLGSKSGFDSVEECYGDLAHEIFAVETGLSSDPEMNWRLSQLDRFTLVSSSDAHSPPKLGREASVFECELDYFAMLRSLKTREGFGGTVEFFPEEGKYHLDGHRKCGVRLDPAQTRAAAGRCPVCSETLTLGVLHRVLELADRDAAAPPAGAPSFRNLVPLEEVIAEVQGVGPKSKAVQAAYEGLVGRLGSELAILERTPVAEIERAGAPRVAEAVSRMREGRVFREAGYDGEYGRIRLFSDGELTRGSFAGLFVETAAEPAGPAAKGRRRPQERDPLADALRATAPTRPDAAEAAAAGETGPAPPQAAGLLAGLDPEQRSAAASAAAAVFVIAGPGTGKTRTLVHRLAHAITELGTRPEDCLAVTFTRRAAHELRERLAELVPDLGARVLVTTFHGAGRAILDEHGDAIGLRRPVRIAGRHDRLRAIAMALGVSGRDGERAAAAISDRKRRVADEPRSADSSEMDLADATRAYDVELRSRGFIDLDDLIALPVRLLESRPEISAACRRRWRSIVVDEFQDIDPLQYRLVRLLASPEGSVCAIGDPDQSIYAFRGADARLFKRFRSDFDPAHTVSLSRSYRSTRAIVEAALQVVRPQSLVPGRELEAVTSESAPILVHACATEDAEAELVVHSIEKLIGGSSFFSIDSGRVRGVESDGAALSFGDFAVLYRTSAQAAALEAAFARSSLPFQRRSHDRLSELPAAERLVEELTRTRESERAESGVSVLERLESAAARLRGDEPLVDSCLEALRPLAARSEGDVDSFLAELSLGVDADFWDPRAERVSLLTLHAAKGLEFPVVFITGCEDGVLPLRWGQGDECDLAEERRLLFVGMTRARHRLILTRAKRRLWRGRVAEMAPSPFLAAIDPRLLEHAAERRPPRRPGCRQLTLFDT